MIVVYCCDFGQFWIPINIVVGIVGIYWRLLGKQFGRIWRWSSFAALGPDGWVMAAGVSPKMAIKKGENHGKSCENEFVIIRQLFFTRILLVYHIMHKLTMTSSILFWWRFRREFLRCAPGASKFQEIHADLRPEEKLAKVLRVAGESSRSFDDHDLLRIG
jgi:hypothetical protein